MSTTTKIELAVELAERMMRTQGYGHGVCLGASLQKGETDIWCIEFAYEGLDGRSETTDPPSIVLSVNLSSEEVRSVELM
jgi:hypothetical protein